MSATRPTKALLVAIATAIVLMTIAGCGPAVPTQKPPEPVARAERVFRLGILGPFSGPSESVGKEFKGAATMALDAIDWRIGHYAIEVVWIDSQSEPEVAAEAYEHAVVVDGIQAAALNWHSSVAVACMEVAAKYQIPHIFPFGATETVNEVFHSDPEKYSYWMNKGWPSPAKLTTAYVQAVETAVAEGAWSPEQKTFAICAENTHWGRSFAQALKQQLEAEGWTAVVEEYARLDEVDFYATLYKLKVRRVALVGATMSSMPSFAAFINEAHEIGLESLIIADGLGWAGDWYRMTGNASNYVIDRSRAGPHQKGCSSQRPLSEGGRCPPVPRRPGWPMTARTCSFR